MALDDTFTITQPGQSGAAGSRTALHIEEFTGMVRETFDRRSVLQPYVDVRNVQGTSVFSNEGIGKSTLQTVVAGAAPDGTTNKFGKKTLSIDTIVIARNIVPILDAFQKHYDVRSKIAREHGKELAKFTDQAFFIQALKAAKLTDTAYVGLTGGGTGHTGGSQEVLASAGDALDPSKMYVALGNALTKMRLKDVDPVADGVMICVDPGLHNVLGQSELLINQQYVTAQGNTIQASILKAYGCPVIASNNLPVGLTIASHRLGTAYDGDFTKDVAVLLAPEALMAGETIPLTANVHYSDIYLQWFIDAYTSFAVGPDRAEYAAVISKP